VYREPVADPHGAYGWRYASTAALRRGDSVAPLALPDSAIPISNLLP
jgi:hypothetical protein